MKILHIDGHWLTEAAEIGETILVTNGEKAKGGDYAGHTEVYTEKAEEAPIEVDLTLSTEQCAVGETVTYDITFSENITVPVKVPISVFDRNGQHVTNIGCDVTDGKSSGSFVMQSAGDFTVTDEAINYHRKVIDKELKLKVQPWLRVYQ